MPSCYSQATNMSPESGLSIAIIFEAHGFSPKMTVPKNFSFKNHDQSSHEKSLDFFQK